MPRPVALPVSTVEESDILDSDAGAGPEMPAGKFALRARAGL